MSGWLRWWLARGPSPTVPLQGGDAAPGETMGGGPLERFHASLEEARAGDALVISITADLAIVGRDREGVVTLALVRPSAAGGKAPTRVVATREARTADPVQVRLVANALSASAEPGPQMTGDQWAAHWNARDGAIDRWCAAAALQSGP